MDIYLKEKIENFFKYNIKRRENNLKEKKILLEKQKGVRSLRCQSLKKARSHGLKAAARILLKQRNACLFSVYRDFLTRRQEYSLLEYLTWNRSCYKDDSLITKISYFASSKTIAIIEEMIKEEEKNIVDFIDAIPHILENFVTNINNIESVGAKVIFDFQSGTHFVEWEKKIIIDHDYTAYDFGIFRIRFPIVESGFFVEAIPCGNNSEINGFFHPHVNERDVVCLGDQTLQFQETFLSGDFLDLVDMTNALLLNYNSYSPYQKIEMWGEDSAVCCSECDKWYLKEDGIWHEEGDFLCPDCGERCEECEETVSRDNWNREYLICTKCFEEIYAECSECFDMYKKEDMCDIGGNLYCSDCVCRCGDCGGFVTEDCFDKELNICLECRSSKYLQCLGCSEYFPKKEIENIDGGCYCSSCAEDLVAKNEEE